MRLGPVLLICVVVVAAVGIVMVASCAADAEPGPPTQRELDQQRQLEQARRYNRRLERQVHRQATRAERNERKLRRARWTFRRALGTSPIGQSWLEGALLCIKSYEAGWRARTGNGYYGGLQMDLDFQRAYGRDYLRHFGTADNWPASVQLAVGIKGWIARGFNPWPNTRKACGL